MNNNNNNDNNSNSDERDKPTTGTRAPRTATIINDNKCKVCFGYYRYMIDSTKGQSISKIKTVSPYCWGIRVDYEVKPEFLEEYRKMIDASANKMEKPHELVHNYIKVTSNSWFTVMPYRNLNAGDYDAFCTLKMYKKMCLERFGTYDIHTNRLNGGSLVYHMLENVVSYSYNHIANTVPLLYNSIKAKSSDIFDNTIYYSQNALQYVQELAIPSIKNIPVVLKSMVNVVDRQMNSARDSFDLRVEIVYHNYDDDDDDDDDDGGNDGR